MKRILLVTIGVAIVAVVAATIGFAKPAAHDRCGSCRGDAAEAARGRQVA